MATANIHRRSKKTAESRRKPKSKPLLASRQIAVAEFKAKCLALIEQVNKTGQEIIITKRGKATAKLVPMGNQDVDEIFGRLKGIVRIVGNPADLVNPVFPLEDWDMLK